MRGADLEVLLRLVERLGGEQRAALGRALASVSGEPETVRLLEEAFAAAPRCPHCGAEELQRWGSASGLRRYRCAACRRTFDALTGTSLARLRKKACWLRYGEALAAGMSLTKAAAHCGVHLTTSFRWRHRFLRAPAAAREARAAWSRRTRPSFAAPTRAPAAGGAATPRPDGGRAGAASGQAGPLGRAGPGSSGALLTVKGAKRDGRTIPHQAPAAGAAADEGRGAGPRVPRRSCATSPKRPAARRYLGVAGRSTLAAQPSPVSSST